MNIFILDDDLQKCVEYTYDKHVVKMPTESTQLLCSALHISGGNAPYRLTHKNHPCSIWARESLSNWKWLWRYTMTLGDEYTYRYGKKHKAVELAKTLQTPNIPDKGLTPFAQCMPEQYKDKDAVKAYRTFYIQDKLHLASWKNRPKPEWYTNE